MANSGRSLNKRKPRTRIPVYDRDRLGRAVASIITRRFDGNMTRAAKGIGIERVTLIRLAKSKSPSVSFRDLDALRHAATAEEFLEVDRAVLSNAAGELLRAFDQWCDSEMTRMLYREETPDTPVGRALAHLPAIVSQRLGEYEHLLAIVRDKCRASFKRFDDFLTGRKHFARRADLAIARVIAPLLEQTNSGGIERSWKDLSAQELQNFVEAGIKRERILLTRLPDLQQAQDVANRDQVEFIDLYGQTVDDRFFFGRNTPPLLRRAYARRVRDSGGR